mmetsp:Transcript_23136/g.55332  ORF Transcript_23136/g.55332 Transcript_23136/m.55332 type:complete len:297 (-) Transcript_23136:73-963(-)
MLRCAASTASVFAATALAVARAASASCAAVASMLAILCAARRAFTASTIPVTRARTSWPASMVAILCAARCTSAASAVLVSRARTFWRTSMEAIWCAARCASTAFTACASSARTSWTATARCSTALSATSPFRASSTRRACSAASACSALRRATSSLTSERATWAWCWSAECSPGVAAWNMASPPRVESITRSAPVAACSGSSPGMSASDRASAKPATFAAVETASACESLVNSSRSFWARIRSFSSACEWSSCSCSCVFSSRIAALSSRVRSLSLTSSFFRNAILRSSFRNDLNA